MLNWFDENPARYWWLVCFAIIWTLFIMLRPVLRPDWQDTKRTDWVWSLVILGVLIAGRWPTWFVTRQFNQDESAFISGAITLRHDLVFWRSVDGGTVGPFIFYALLPAGWIHGIDDYFSARLTALALIAIALIFAHQTLALVFGRQVARMTGFAAVCLEAFTLHDDLLHYSSELVPISLLALAFYLFARRFATNADWKWNAVGGLALGAVPFAKLQVAPLAALLGMGWLASEFLWWRGSNRIDRRNSLIALGGGAVTPLAICIIFLTTFGLWHYALSSYLLNNVAYIGAAYLGIGNSLMQVWWSADSENSLVPQWIAGSLLWLLLSLPLARAANRPDRFITGSTVLFCVTSLLCVLVPRRPFLHYWQLVVVPSTLVLGATTGLMVQALAQQRSIIRCSVLCAALLCSTGGLLFVRAGLPHPYLGRLVYFQTYPQGAVARKLVKYAHRGEALGAWGWMNNVYVESGLRRAFRMADSPFVIWPGPYNSYYRRTYLADLQRSIPPVFVDAVGPGNFTFQNRRLAHDAIFPELAAYIRAHYTLVADLQGSRIYVRNDRLAATLH
jgi:hypothetical protein